MKDIDHSIVEILQRDARITNRALAASVSLAPSTTLGRVRELERRGVVTGYHARVDLACLGRALQALVFVRLRPKTDKVVEAFVASAWEMSSTIGLYLISGNDDACVHVAVGSTEELRQAVLVELSNIPGVVDERTSIIFEHRPKDVILPTDTARPPVPDSSEAWADGAGADLGHH